MELLLRCAYCTVNTFGIGIIGNNYTANRDSEESPSSGRTQGYRHLILFQIFRLHQLDWILVQFALCQHNAGPPSGAGRRRSPAIRQGTRGLGCGIDFSSTRCPGHGIRPVDRMHHRRPHPAGGPSLPDGCGTDGSDERPVAPWSRIRQSAGKSFSGTRARKSPFTTRPFTASIPGAK